MTPVDMTISPVDPRSLEQLRAFQDVTDAVFAADVPDLPPSPFEELVAQARTSQTSRRESRWLLRDDAAAVGVARASYFLRDNTDQCAVMIAVHPEHRRRGYGESLFDFLVATATIEDCVRLVTEIAEPLVDGDSTPGPAFATAMGATRALDEIRACWISITSTKHGWTRLRRRLAHVASATRRCPGSDRHRMTSSTTTRS